jgi:hypothetical protein
MQHQDSNEDDDDDGEEECLEEERTGQNLEAEGGIAKTDDAAEMYKSTNSFLHDLHALHQHRFIPPNPPTPSPSSNSPTQYPQSPPPCPAISHYQSSYDSYTPTKHGLSPLSEQCSRLPAYLPETNRGLEDGVYLGEVQKVKDRYEDTNRCVLLFLFRLVFVLIITGLDCSHRLLGSLVLSRRRELQGTSQR